MLLSSPPSSAANPPFLAAHSASVSPLKASSLFPGTPASRRCSSTTLLLAIVFISCYLLLSLSFSDLSFYTDLSSFLYTFNLKLPATPVSPSTSANSNSSSNSANSVASTKSAHAPSLSVLHGTPCDLCPATPLSDSAVHAFFNFSAETTLNFMHLHKTGGSSVKIAFYVGYNNRTKRSPATQQVVPLRVQGSCHERAVDKVRCAQCSRYVCSWKDLAGEADVGRHHIDVAFGHQFLHGPDSLHALLPRRRVQTFTIVRHPFARKLSAFFHFLVHARGRLSAGSGEGSPETVSIDDIAAFMLSERGEKGTVGRKIDVGPNYYVGRFVSEGYDSYHSDPAVDDRLFYYRVNDNGSNGLGADAEADAVAKAKKVLDGFLFVGVQQFPVSTLCVLKQMLQSFDDRMGIVRPAGEPTPTDRFVAFMRSRRENTGRYHVAHNASATWAALTAAQRAAFAAHEKHDLAVYRHAVDRFLTTATHLGCAHLFDDDLAESGVNAALDGDFDGLLADALRRHAARTSTATDSD